MSCFHNFCTHMVLSTAPNDYTSLSEDISFQPATTSQRICTSVTVDDDMVLEAEETFLIILETSDTRVILIAENSRTSVRISDNDDGIYEYCVEGIFCSGKFCNCVQMYCSNYLQVHFSHNIIV